MVAHCLASCFFFLRKPADDAAKTYFVSERTVWNAKWDKNQAKFSFNIDIVKSMEMVTLMFQCYQSGGPIRR